MVIIETSITIFVSFQMIKTINHNPKEPPPTVYPSSFEWSHCSGVAFSNKIFTQRFISELSEEISKVANGELEMPIMKMNFEQDWSAIFNFFVYPILCTLFMGHTDPELHAMNGEYTIIKQTSNSNNLKKTFTMDLGHEITAILNLSNHSDFEGGGIEFHG